MLKPLTKRELNAAVCEQMAAEGVEMDMRTMNLFLASLAEVVAREVAEGVKVTVPGVAVITPSFVEAKKRRKGINRFTGEEQWFKAKPASLRLKARPAAALRRELPAATSAAGKAVAKAARSRKRRA